MNSWLVNFPWSFVNFTLSTVRYHHIHAKSLVNDIELWLHKINGVCWATFFLDTILKPLCHLHCLLKCDYYLFSVTYQTLHTVCRYISCNHLQHANLNSCLNMLQKGIRFTYMSCGAREPSEAFVVPVLSLLTGLSNMQRRK